MVRAKKPRAPALQQGTQTSDAVFKGWQKTDLGESFALYNVTAAGHPSLGSTVTGKSLLALNLQIPRTPLRPVKT